MSNITQLRGLICVFLLVGAQAAEEVNLPSSITIPNCNHKFPNYSVCIRSAFEESWPTIMNGISQLDLPALDPFKIEILESKYQIFILTTSLVFRDATAYGLGNMMIKAVRPTRSANRMSVDVDYVVPGFFAEGNYEASGGVGPFLRVGGQGYFNLTVEGRGTWGLEGHIENDRWVLEHVRVNYPSIVVDKLKVYFDDVFNGNRMLNKWALNYVNKSWPVFYKALLPVLQKVWGKRLANILNRLIFSKLSFAKVFP